VECFRNCYERDFRRLLEKPDFIYRWRRHLNEVGYRPVGADEEAILVHVSLECPLTIEFYHVAFAIHVFRSVGVE
jgi:hypothetical protein